MKSMSVVMTGNAASRRSNFAMSLASELFVAASVLLLASFTTSCGMFQAGSHTTPPTNAVTIAVTPGSATVLSGASKQFTATVTNTSNAGSTWSATSGKISANGMFTAPSVTTSTTVTVTAVSLADSTKQATATIFVTPTGMPLAVQTSALPNATTGTAYLEALIASGGEAPYHWTLGAGALPQGIQIDASNGSIGGTTSSSGSFSFTVVATDAASHSATRQLSLAVANQTTPLVVQTVTLPNATEGTSYIDTLAASGGEAPYRWSISSGTLPTGIQLNSSGSISGTAYTTGSFSFIVQATDAASNTSTRQLALAVGAPSIPLAVQTSALPDATAGTAYLQTLAASGGQAPYQWSVSAGALPQGFQLDASTGAVGGTTNASGSFTFTVTAKDTASHTATRQLAVVALAAEGSQPVIPRTFFGLQSMATGGTYPTVSFGSFRLWDNDVAWNVLNPSQGTYTYTNIDGILGQLKSHGISDGVVYTFGLVPNWASSAPTDAACDLNALGGCDLPTDLNPDGTGTNQTFINFVQSIAEHVNSASYLQTHAHVKYWEPWNEWYRDPVLSIYNQGCIAAQTCSIRATYAQMVRMTEDLRCVVTGTGSVNGVACSRTAIDPSAKIITPASHGRSSFGVSVMENFLHCDSKPQASALCTTGDRGRNAIDVLNFHFYAMLSETAEEIPFHVSNIKAGLRSADLAAMPLWSGEGGWGFDTSLPDPDLQQAFLVRYYLLGWTSGISMMSWYEFDNSGWGTLYAPQTHGSLTPAGLAYQEVYGWLAGNSMAQGCTGPTYPAQGVWTCAITTPSGSNMLAVWDSSQSCSNGVCSTSLYSQNPIYSSYESLDGKRAAVTRGSIAIGAKPILLIQ
jgi:Putative Ig domain